MTVGRPAWTQPAPDTVMRCEMKQKKGECEKLWRDILGHRQELQVAFKVWFMEKICLIFTIAYKLDIIFL